MSAGAADGGGPDFPGPDPEGVATLYGLEISYFSGKARSYLRRRAIPFRERAPSPEVMRRLITPRTGRPVIPVVVAADGAVLQDSSLIIAHYEAALGRFALPETPRQALAALLLEIFGDEWMLAPAMRWRWRYDADWVCADLGRVLAPDAPPETRRALGAERLAPFRAAAAALGITEETGPEIERATLALLERLDAVLARSPYLLGARPSIGDFGMIGPLYAHLGRDPTPKALIAERAPNVAAWTARMMRPAEAGETPGAFAAADAVSAPLTRALAEMTALQAPLLREAEAATAAWLAGAAPGAEAPRAAGRGVFRIGGAEAPVALRPYSLWMLQRARDAYAALAPAARAAADGFLDQIGAGELLRERPERRLALTDFRLRAA